MKRSPSRMGDISLMHGIALSDPRQVGVELACYVQEVSLAVGTLIRQHHHQKEKRPLIVDMCRIEPPMGPRHSIARIILIYHIADHGWRHVFSVTHSSLYGLRLWTDVRNRIAVQSTP